MSHTLSKFGHSYLDFSDKTSVNLRHPPPPIISHKTGERKENSSTRQANRDGDDTTRAFPHSEKQHFLACGHFPKLSCGKNSFPPFHALVTLGTFFLASRRFPRRLPSPRAPPGAPGRDDRRRLNPPRGTKGRGSRPWRAELQKRQILFPPRKVPFAFIISEGGNYGVGKKLLYDRLPSVGYYF